MSILFIRLKELIDFSSIKEITIELNPETINCDKLAFYKTVGVNRISIGCQSTDDTVLSSIGRKTNWDEIKTAFYNIRNTGFHNVNVDFIFGLPNQTIDILKKDIDRCISLESEHISYYNFTNSRKLINKLIHRNHYSNPDEQTVLKEYLYIMKTLKEKQYKQYEISNYSKKDFKCLHNCSYWNGDNYIGLGLSSSGFINGYRYKNFSKYNKYKDSIKSNNFPYEELEYLTDEQKRLEYLYLNLRQSKGINLIDYKSKFNLELPIQQSKINYLIDNKLIVLNDKYFRLTKRGIPIMDSILHELI